MENIWKKYFSKYTASQLISFVNMYTVVIHDQ